MRHRRDPWVALMLDADHRGWHLEAVGAVDPWAAPSSAIFVAPASASEEEQLRITQARRPWLLLLHFASGLLALLLALWVWW